MTGPTGAAPTGATGAGATGATGPAPTGATGPVKDKRIVTFKVPDQYAKEPWAKEVKSPEDLWAKMAGAQKLIGKDKITLPGEGATQDELNAFQIRMGRPETADGYTFNSIESLKEVDRNQSMDTGMKKIFFDEGVSKAAGERIVAKYEEMIYDMHKPTIDAGAKRDMDFQKLADEVLGADKASAMTAFQAVMKESLGDKAHLASAIEHMTNEQLMPMIVLAKNIHDKYTGENRVIGRPGAPQGLSGDLKTDFQSLSSAKLAIKQDNNMPEHIKKTKLANINVQMQKIGVKAKDQNIDLFAQ